MREEIKKEFHAKLEGEDNRIQAMANLHGKEMANMQSKLMNMASQKQSNRKAANEVRYYFLNHIPL